MKLIIDRAVNQPNIYTVAFGPDYDCLILKFDIPMNVISTTTMSNIDYIVTNSPDLVFCVLNIKHPVLQREYKSQTPGHFFTVNEDIYKNKLRTFFALRLKYRQSPVQLFDDGKRLFH